VAIYEITTQMHSVAIETLDGAAVLGGRTGRRGTVKVAILVMDMAERHAVRGPLAELLIRIADGRFVMTIVLTQVMVGVRVVRLAVHMVTLRHMVLQLLLHMEVTPETLHTAPTATQLMAPGLRTASEARTDLMEVGTLDKPVVPMEDVVERRLMMAMPTVDVAVMGVLSEGPRARQGRDH